MRLFQYIFNHTHHAARNRARYLLIDLAAHRIGQIISNALVGFFAPAEQAAQKAAHHAVLLRRRGSGLVGLSLRFGGILRFGRLRLLRFDAEGRQHSQSLSQAGVAAIELGARDVKIALGAYDEIAQLGRFQFSDGRSGEAADLLLARR